MTWTHAAFEDLGRLLSRHTGLTFPVGRTGHAELGIRRAMSRAGVSDPDRYRDQVACDPDALADLVAEVTVGETYFFREKDQLEFIRHTVLAGLRHRPGGVSSVRAWSAGCASGEEAYSLAIIFEEEGAGEQAFLLGTDVSRTALAKARRACFGSWSLRGEGATAARRYLQPRGSEFVLDERITRRVRFEHLNLVQDVYPSCTGGVWGMDLILCRNVLIYFDRDTIRDVARRLYDTLAPGGWLFTGASDPPLTDYAPFEIVMTPVGVFYRRTSECGLRIVGCGIEYKKEQQIAEPLVSEPTPVRSSIPLSAFRIPHSEDPLDEARGELALGNYARVCELTHCPTDALASVLHVRALANLDTMRAERACAEAVGRHPFSMELHHLHTILLVALGNDEEATRAVRRLLYLDRTLVIAHFTLGSILERRGDSAGAARAFRNAGDLCSGWSPDEEAPLSDGVCCGGLAEAAAASLAVLDPAAQ